MRFVMEDVMGFFSKELYEMDRNTAEYMVDEMKRELEMSKKDNEKLERELEEMRKAYEALKNKR